MIPTRRQPALGMTLLITAALGVFISLLGIILIWTVGIRVQTSVDRILALADNTLTTSDHGLTVLADSLANISTSISLMETTSQNISQSIDQTIPMVDSTGNLVGNNMVQVIEKTQASLASAQSSAKLVDDTLGLITSLPIIGRRYAPSQSLSSSIQQVSQSLQGLPETLTGLKTNLTTTSNDMRSVQAQVKALSSDLSRIGDNVTAAQEVVRQYQQQVSDLRTSEVNLRHNLPTWMLLAQIGATLFLIWLAAAQLSLILQGVQLMRGVGVLEMTGTEEEG